MPELVAYLVALVLVCDMAVLGVDYLADETTFITDAPRTATATEPPGRYRARASVAVGSAGLATPTEGAAFTADAHPHRGRREP